MTDMDEAKPDWAGWSEEKREMVRRVKSMSIEERLDDRTVAAPSGCLEWTGLKDKYGYGKISYKSKYDRVHRLRWKLANGPIPKGLKVLHKCDNPACSNLDHLFLGTQDDNMKDMAFKGRGRSSLTKDQVLQIRADSRKVGVIAMEYNISHQVASNIRSGRSWKHL